MTTPDESGTVIRCAICGSEDGHMLWLGDQGWVCDGCDACPTCGDLNCMEDTHG